MKRGSLFWLVLFIGVESSAGEVDGPVWRRLKFAVSRPPVDGAPESWSEWGGVPFDENYAALPASGRGCDRGARRRARAVFQRESAKTGNAPVPASRRGTIPIEDAAPFENGGRQSLNTARALGSIAAGAGLGLFAYALAAETAGPIGWAAALVFFGGLAAYAAHRRLGGR